ncbi:MAG: LysR family transcriptional regulator, partial [Pseudomonadota bacterium]
MTHAQLRAFHYVAALGGFSVAADRLGLTQPAVSDQVRKLEHENDVLLFSRARKKVRLTAQGEALFQMTRAYFDMEAEIKQHLSESSKRIEGELRIVADSAFHIGDLVQRFRALHPKVRV